MATRFDKALEFALRWEGGLSDDPDDRGGRTMQGVTQRVYDAWRKQRGLITQDVALIGKDADSDRSQPGFPRRSRPLFRSEAGRHSEMKPATQPRF